MLLSHYSSHRIEAGCDEAGRGCLAGPVVAAAVILPSHYKHDLLNDSKQLNSSQRSLIEVDIKREAISWAIGEVSSQMIDEINILNASFRAMHQAISRLKVDPNLLIIDGNRFTAYQDIPHKCIIKGDAKFASIAAASVLAKTYRDDLMRTLALKYPEYGWTTNVGYPTKKHRQMIQEKGVTKHHRMSFRLLNKFLNPF